MWQKSLGVPVEIYDFTLPDVRKKEIAFTKTNLVFFGTPVIAGRGPNVLLPYLKTVVGGKAARSAYGILRQPTLMMPSSNCGTFWKTTASAPSPGGAFVSEHSFSRKLSAGRPDEEDYKVMHEFAGKNRGKRKINSGSGNTTGPAYVKGESTPCRDLGSAPREGLPWQGPRHRRQAKPKTSDACCGCGLCAEVCPYGLH